MNNQTPTAQSGPSAIPEAKEYPHPFKYNLDMDDSEKIKDRAYVDGWNECREEIRRNIRDAAKQPPAGARDAVRRAGLLLPVLRNSAESWGNHHCADELRRAIELVDDLLALTGKADVCTCRGDSGQCPICSQPDEPQPAATGAVEAIRLIQRVIPWVSEGSQADLRKVIALVSAMDPAKAPDPIEAAEGFLEIALTAFTERQSIDSYTGYGEYNDRDEEYHADLVSALAAVKGLHDVPPDRRNEDFDHE